MFKKIWAIVSEKDFCNFRDRCRADGESMKDMFAKLVHNYSQGYDLYEPKKVEKHSIKTGVDYISEKN